MHPQLIDDYSAPIQPQPEPPQPPPPPPELVEKPAEEQREIIEGMTEEQVAEYSAEVAELPQSEREDVAKQLAENLDADGLAKIRPAFAQDNGNAIDTAVENFASADVQADYPGAVSATDAGMRDTLSALGLTREDVEGQPLAVFDTLSEAAAQIESGDVAGAIETLGGVDGKALAGAALQGIAGQLPAPASDILSNADAVEALVDAGPELLAQIADGDLAGALQSAADNDTLRDALIAAAFAPGTSLGDAAGTLGLDVSDLQQAGAGLPDLVRAASFAGEGNWQDAALALLDAGDSVSDLVAGGLQELASHLPEPAASILGNSDVAAALAGASSDALRELVNGNPGEALKALVGDTDLRDAVIDAALKDPDSAFSVAVSSLGLTADDLKAAGDALPSTMEAVALAADGKWSEAANALADAAEQAPELVAKGIRAIAAELPSPASDILGNEKVSELLAELGPDALRALVDGDPAGALEHLAGEEELRDAVIDVAFELPNSGFVATVEQMGLTADDLKALGDGLPDVMRAVGLVSKPDATAEDWRQAGLALAEASSYAPEVISKGLQALAGQLPEGLAQTILGDAEVADALAAKGPEALTALLEGDIAGALTTLATDKTLRDAVIDAAATDPGVAAQLESANLTAADLKQAGDAAPHLFAAIDHLAKGEVDQALVALGEVVDAAPALLGKIGSAIYGQLDDDVRGRLADMGVTSDTIEELAAALPSLVEAAEAVGDGRWADAVEHVLAAGEAAPESATALITGLAEGMEDGLAKQLLGDETIAAALASDPALHDAISQILDGQVLEGSSALLHNDAVRDRVLEVVGGDPRTQDALEAVGLTPEDLMQAGAAAPHLVDAGIALLDDGDFEGALDALGQAADAAPELLGKVVEKVFDALPDGVKEQFEELGITREDIAQAGAALPHFVDAIRELTGGPDVLAALDHLGEAVTAAPDLAGKLINAIGEQLPDTPELQLLKSLLTDEALVSTLLGNEDLHQALTQILQGDVTGGLQAIGDNAEVMEALANVLAQDEGLMARLEPLGLDSAEDLAALGPAMADLLGLADAIADKDIAGAISALGEFASSLPDGVRDTIIDSLTAKFDLKPEIVSLLEGALDAMSSPEVAEAIGAAIEAFNDGDPVDFISKLGEAAAVLFEEAPGLATSFLNSLTVLPGSVGDFFADPELNAAIVESGSLSHMFDAASKLAAGDVEGALGALGDAIGAFITYGEKAKILGFELPFGEQAVELIGKLVSQFIEALPPQVKTFMEKQAAEAVASTGFRSIPFVGPVAGVIDAGGDLIGHIADGASGLTIALDAADLLVNAASLFPPAAAALTPLKTLLGVAQGINATMEFVGDMSDFGQQFTGM